MKPHIRFSLIELVGVAFLSMVLGILLGAGGLFAYQTLQTPLPDIDHDVSQQSSIIPTDLTGETPARSIGVELPGEGFYILGEDGTPLQISPLPIGVTLNLSSLPTIGLSRPSIAIKGDNFPLGNLELLAYNAGIGIDISRTDSGALVNEVFQGSPAQAAGIHPGDVILTINTEPAQSPMAEVYTRGHHDLIGPMQERITLLVISGTTSREVTLPRTFRDFPTGMLNTTLQRAISFSIKPESEYVLLHPDRELEPGTYVLVFRPRPYHGSSLQMFGPTSTPTPLPIPIPEDLWAFVIK